MSFFKRFISSKPKLANDSFVNPITTELHSHLIPGIDDGIQELEESIEVLRFFHNLGYKKVITTPHVMADFYKNNRDTILPWVQTINAACAAQQLPITLEAAAEYMVDDGLEQKIDAGEIISFGKQKYVLIEMPFEAPAPNLKQIIFALRLNGYTPVLAHPERYLYYAANVKHYHDLWDAEVLFQLNLGSLVGHYGPLQLKAASYLITNKLVNLVGSDCHGMRHASLVEAALNTQLYEQVCALPLLNNTL